MSILAALTTTKWFPFGPAPIDAPGVGLGFAAGRIEAAAPHPTSAGVMYVAGNNGGVWKTGVWNNEPPVWIMLGDDQASLNFAGYHPLVVHPANPNLVLGTVSGHGAGILKSTNGGFGWQLLGNATFDGLTLGSIAIHPANTNILYVSVWNGGPFGGVYKSTDGGVTWTNTTTFHSGPATDVVVARFNSQVLFAGLVAGNTATAGVYKSINGGTTWTLMNGLPSGANLANAVRLESASTNGVAYATCFTTQGSNILVRRFRTGDTGQTWKALAATPGTAETRSWHLLLGVDPSNDKHVFANDAYALYESKDSGATWTRADMQGGKAIGDDWVNINFAPKGSVVVTADRDVYKYDPAEKSWKSKEGNLQVTLFYDVTPDPKNPDVAYGVAQDHPRAMKFTGSIEWAYMPAGGETGRVLISPANTSVLYVSNPLDPNTFVARSIDAGLTWKIIYVASDFVANDYSLAYSVQKSFAMDQTAPARLLIGTTKVWQTTNATAATPIWKAISGILGGASVSQQYITALAIALSDPKTVYAATSDGHVWATANGGTNWGARDTGLFGSGGGNIVDIRIDPKNPEHAFAVGSTLDSVWHLAKIGGTLQWKNIKGDLPTYLQCATIFADWSFATPVLYVGTTRGVYQSVNLGAHWSVFGLDMPHTVVSDLQSVTQNVLVASTIGRGAWAILIKPSKVAGKIVNLPLDPAIVHAGDPVEGVKVLLHAGGGDAVLTAVTDARGQYRFDNVPPGTYTVHPIAPSGHAADGDAAQIAVHGSDIDDLDFHYRFSPDHGRAGRPYEWIADLGALPGRQFGEAIGGRNKREKADGGAK